MRLQPIIEGHGEIEAVPILLRRLCDEAQAWHVQISYPIRRTRAQLITRDGVVEAVQLALNANSDAIPILFDADDDCPAATGPMVRAWARQRASHLPCEVVLPNREYEAWFLASTESLRGLSKIRADAEFHAEPESPRGAKEQLTMLMEPGHPYDPRIHQPALSAQFSLQLAHQRSRSFQKLTKAFAELLLQTNSPPNPWPPTSWART